MAIATDTDLELLRADILEHGVLTWADQLAMAEADVIELVKTEWFVEAAKSLYGYGLQGNDYQVVVSQFNIAHLNTSALKNLICYRAMAWYIYPSLTRDTDDGLDAFSRRAERYKAFYEGEWDAIKRMPLYDFNSDSNFEDVERVSPARIVRIVRA